MKKRMNKLAVLGNDVSAAEARFQERNAKVLGHNSGEAETVNIKEELIRRFTIFADDQHTFMKGDLVQWRRGLKNRNLPPEANLMVVYEVLKQELVADEAPITAVGAREPLDLRVCCLAKNPQTGYVDFLEIYIDSRRVEPYVSAEDE